MLQSTFVKLDDGKEQTLRQKEKEEELEVVDEEEAKAEETDAFVWSLESRRHCAT
jgi:hypothetical protein